METKKTFNKKLLVFGLPILTLALITGAILQYYGSIQQTVNVQQAVISENVFFEGSNIVAGDTIVNCSYVKNKAKVVAPIQFRTTCNNSEGYDDGTRNETSINWATVGGDECNGIVTEIYGILELTKKNTSTWQPLDGESNKITIRYTIVGDTFSYDVLKGTIPANYELVYAMDKANRFTDYATVKTVSEINSVSEGLPMVGDWNADAYPDYCENHNGFDSYEHCVGAKLWIIPTSNIGANGVLNWANMADYYYETDLIMYSDDTGNVMNLLANGGGFNFCVDNSFALNLVPDTYTLETQIVPTA